MNLNHDNQLKEIKSVALTNQDEKIECIKLVSFKKWIKAPDLNKNNNKNELP